MPEPPGVSLITNLLFDNPWPLGAALFVATIVLLVFAERRREQRLLVFAGVALLLAVCLVGLERAVVTSGEHAAEVARDLVEAAENADVQTARSLFSDDAVMSLVDPRNPGVGIDVIHRRLDMLEGRYTVEENAITGSDSYSVDSEHGVVHLHLSTKFPGALGYATPSSWVIEVSRQPNGDWKITHLTFVKYNLNQSPSTGLFR